MKKRYSVYRAKDDTPLIVYASASMCARAMGISINTFYRYISRLHGRELAPKKWDIYEDPPEQPKEKKMKVTPRLQVTVNRLQNESPCTRCGGEQWCVNKQCLKWQKWFLKEWKKFNNYYEKHKEELCNGK